MIELIRDAIDALQSDGDIDRALYALHTAYAAMRTQTLYREQEDFMKIYREYREELDAEQRQYCEGADE